MWDSLVFQSSLAFLSKTSQGFWTIGLVKALGSVSPLNNGVPGLALLQMDLIPLQIALPVFNKPGLGSGGLQVFVTWYFVGRSVIG